MSDLFHEDITDDYVRAVFAVMERAPRHTFYTLTKRPGRLLDLAASLPWPQHVWMGVTVEGGREAARADALGRVPAAVRHVSAEPLVGPLDELDLAGIDLVVAGGESGPGRRPPQPDWLRSLRDRCLAAGVAFTFKGWGGATRQWAGAWSMAASGGSRRARPPAVARPRCSRHSSEREGLGPASRPLRQVRRRSCVSERTAYAITRSDLSHAHVCSLILR